MVFVWGKGERESLERENVQMRLVIRFVYRFVLLDENVSPFLLSVVMLKSETRTNVEARMKILALDSSLLETLEIN